MLRVSNHVARGAKFHSGPKFHSGNKAMRYSGSKFRVSNYGKPHHGNAKKWYGKNISHYRYGKYPYYRRYNYYPWYGASLYTYGGRVWVDLSQSPFHRQRLLVGPLLPVRPLFAILRPHLLT